MCSSQLQLNIVSKTKSFFFLLTPLPFLVFSSHYRTMIHLVDEATKLVVSHYFSFSLTSLICVWVMTLPARLTVNRCTSTSLSDTILGHIAIIHSNRLIIRQNWKLSNIYYHSALVLLGSAVPPPPPNEFNGLPSPLLISLFITIHS